MKTRAITEIINACHASNDSTIGEPNWIRKTGRPIVPVIDLSSAHEFLSTDDLERHYQDPLTSIRYGRDSSSTALQVEYYLGAVYDRPAFLFDSGMSAISAALEVAALRANRVVVVGETYRKTEEQLRYMRDSGSLESLGHVDFETVKELSLDESTVILFEAMTNPHLRVADLQLLRQIGEASGSFLIVDATLAGLDNAQAHFRNFDIVVHSATKYISGFNDVLAGVCWCRPELETSIWQARSRRGGLLDPWSCYLLFRSLRTYDLRCVAQRKNTEAILRALQESRIVERIFYPGRFANASQSDVFTKNFEHGGSLVSFLVDLPQSVAAHNFQRLQHVKTAPSFGSVDSLIEMPALMSHFGKTPAELESVGIQENLVRLSVGCEPLDMLLADLDRLLRR